MHVRGAERDGDPVLPVHAEDVHRALPSREVRQSGPGQQAASQGNTFSWSEWFVPNFDPGSVEKNTFQSSKIRLLQSFFALTLHRYTGTYDNYRCVRLETICYSLVPIRTPSS